MPQKSPRVKAKPEEPSKLLHRINALQAKCQNTLGKCENLGKCHLNTDEEIAACQDQLQILAAIKRLLFPNEP